MTFDTVPADTKQRRYVADALAEEIKHGWRGHELDRVLEGLDIWCYRAPARTHDRQLAAGFHVPGLPDDPWIEPDEFDCSQILLDAFADIREEASCFMDGRMVAPPHGLPDELLADAKAYVDYPEGWREWRFARHGRFNESLCKMFPATDSAIRRVKECSPFLVNAQFLILRPGASIPMHYDPINAYANLWLGIFVPNGATLCIRGESRTPPEGGLMGFDHTFEHGSSNAGASDRVVLNLVIHNPRLRPHELEIASFLIPRLKDFGGARTVLA